MKDFPTNEAEHFAMPTKARLGSWIFDKVIPKYAGAAFDLQTGHHHYVPY